MPLFEDNLSPYLTLVEQASTPASPSAGDQKLFIKTADHLLYRVDSSGTVSAVGGGGTSTPSGVSAHLTGTTSVTSDPFTISWPTPDYDPNSYYSAGAPTKYTVPTGKGGRLFAATVTLESNFSVSNGQVHLVLNGTTTVGYAYGMANYVAPAVSVILELADADYLTVVVTGLNGHGIISTDCVTRFSLAPVG